MYLENRKTESKQMLDPLGRARQKWQRVGCLTSGCGIVNKQCLFGPLLRPLLLFEFEWLSNFQRRVRAQPHSKFSEHERKVICLRNAFVISEILTAKNVPIKNLIFDREHTMRKRSYNLVCCCC